MNNIKIYVNAVEKGSTAFSSSLATNDKPFLMGSDRLGGGNGRFFKGTIDEVGIWSRALSTAEINTLYAGTQHRINIEHIGWIKACDYIYLPKDCTIRYKAYYSGVSPGYHIYGPWVYYDADSTEPEEDLPLEEQPA